MILTVDRSIVVKYYGSLIVVTLLMIGMYIFNPIPVNADITVTYYFDEGATFHNGTDLHMPQANVSIVFNHTTSGDNLTILCDFEIYTNTSQNTTLAFAYPNTWDWTFSKNASITKFISKNNQPLNFTTYSWEQLGWNSSDYESNELESLWLEDTLFSVFNLELNGNTSTLISVKVYAWDFPWSHYFNLDYIVGSARTFESDTHQRINVRIVENAPIYGLEFWPNESLSISENGNNTDAFWEFNVSDFEHDVVRFCVYVSEYHHYSPYPITSTTATTFEPFTVDPMVVAALGTTGLIAIVLVVIIVDYRKQ